MVGHHMVMADLGDGTADLITYRINNHQPLAVEGKLATPITVQSSQTTGRIWYWLWQFV